MLMQVSWREQAALRAFTAVFSSPMSMRLWRALAWTVRALLIVTLPPACTVGRGRLMPSAEPHFGADLMSRSRVMATKTSANLIDFLPLSTGEPHNGMLPGCRAFPRQAGRAIMPHQIMDLKRRTNKGPIQTNYAATAFACLAKKFGTDIFANSFFYELMELYYLFDSIRSNTDSTKLKAVVVKHGIESNH